MSALKALGGILALVGGALVLLLDLLWLFSIDVTAIFPVTAGLFAMALAVGMEPAILYIQLIVGLIAVIGGILGLAGKRAGGALALIAGVIWLIGGFLWGNVVILTPLSSFLGWTNLIVISTGSSAIVITVEAILSVVGGIMILPGGKD